MNMLKTVACIIALLGLSACAVTSEPVRVDPSALLGPRAEDANKAGLALAGGGTKAASYSMGILAALASAPDNELEKMTAISSVSLTRKVPELRTRSPVRR